MYHVELRDFPHNLCRFNLDEPKLRAIVIPWARQQPFEFGEERWNPVEAKITILEGPEIPLGQLTMGRGWGAAQRKGQDVTVRVLGEARAAVGAVAGAGAPGAPVVIAAAGASVPSPALGAGAAGGDAAGPPPVDAFALGVQMASLLGPDAMRLLEAWREVAARSGGLAPSETLALAERSLREGAQ